MMRSIGSFPPRLSSGSSATSTRPSGRAQTTEGDSIRGASSTVSTFHPSAATGVFGSAMAGSPGGGSAARASGFGSATTAAVITQMQRVRRRFDMGGSVLLYDVEPKNERYVSTTP